MTDVSSRDTSKPNPDFRALLARLRQQRYRLKRRTRQLAARPGGLILAQHGERKRGALVTPSILSPGAWRVTYFDVDGFSGDSTYQTKQEAIRDCLRDGYRRPAPTLLRSLAATDRFHAGNAATELIQKLNQRPCSV